MLVWIAYARFVPVELMLNAYNVEVVQTIILPGGKI
jgi:hypothetical protein